MTDLAVFGMFNLRDVGGLRTGDGRVVRSGVLLRSDSPHRVPADEATALVELGIALVIDLRSPTELDDLGVSQLPLPTVHMPLFTDARTTDMGPVDNLADVYVMMLEAAGPKIGDVITRLAQPRSLPALVHCTAGKDRTGLVVGLLLSAVGVTDADVATDYARTSENTQTALAWLAANDPPTHAHLASRPAWILEAEAATMLHVLGHLREDHGSVAAWIGSVGVSAASLHALEAALVS